MQNWHKKLTQGKPVNIVFLGDSITQGHYELDPQRTRYLRSDEVYPQQFISLISAQYPDAKINAYNAGVGGQTAQQGFNRIKSEALDIAPDLCVVCFGLNDTFVNKPKQYQRALENIFQALNDADIDTLFLTPNPMGHRKVTNWGLLLRLYSTRTSRLMRNGTMDDFMRIARGVALEKNVTVADGYAEWMKRGSSGQDMENLLCNGINHPSAQGHRILAEVLFRTLLEQPVTEPDNGTRGTKYENRSV